VSDSGVTSRDDVGPRCKRFQVSDCCMNLREDGG